MSEAEETLYCALCLEDLLCEHFRVLPCGHYFCIPCLTQWAEQVEDGAFSCPVDRTPATMSQCSPVAKFEGQLFSSQNPDENDLSISALLHSQMVLRSKTIRYLRSAIDELISIEMSTSVAKLTGSSIGVIGSIMVIVGGSLCLTGAGAVAGVPLLVAGSSVGIGGGLTVAGSIVVESLLKSHRLEGINEHLQRDYFKSVQLRILIGRAAVDPKFASRLGLPSEDATSLVALLPRAAKLTGTGVLCANAAARVLTRGATAGMHVAGIICAGILIPIDLWQLVESSLKLHHRDVSRMIEAMLRFVSDLEEQLRELLRERGYVTKTIQWQRPGAERASTVTVGVSAAAKPIEYGMASNFAEYAEEDRGALLEDLEASAIVLTMRIMVRHAEHTFPVYVDPEDTVKRVKEKIGYTQGTRSAKKTLVFGDRPLADDQPLAFYGVDPDAALELMDQTPSA